MSRGDDTPPGLTLSAARRVVAAHRNGANCRHCEPRRCWVLESAVRIWILDGLPPAGTVDRELLTVGAQRVVGSHWPSAVGDGECPVCWVVDCEPPRDAYAYLAAIRDGYMPAAKERTVMDMPTPTPEELREITGM